MTAVHPLRPALERLYRDFDIPDSAADPIHVVRRYKRPDDREVVGFCASALAFGRVASVLHSIERVCDILGPSPAAAVRAFDPEQGRRAFRGFVHRWTTGDDLVALVWILRHMLERGSIESFFLQGDDSAGEHVGPALESFSSRALAVDLKAIYGRKPRTPGVRYFFPTPAGGSGCKRLNLFLRWMVRRDAIDLGVWTRVSPARLIVPLDTHVIRVGRCLRLTDYRSAGWRMAVEITSSLRQIDPVDPVKYDFAMCHLGMLSACGFSKAQQDARCPLRGLCRPSAGMSGESHPPSARR